ncbi:MAG: phospholipase [Actinomycetota bacterium]
MLPANARSALASVASTGSSLTDIEHVVILVQENRSFDHYFGTLSGVAGFDDPHAAVDPLTGRSVFEQPDPYLLDGAGGTLRPYHLDTHTTSAQCLRDVGHSWIGQHFSVNGGANNGWLLAHTVEDGVLDGLGSQDADVIRAGGTRVMGFHTRADLPLHYALADAFTVCDQWYCSVIGPTNPNRLMLMSATIDPEGAAGGPVIDNEPTGFSWETYPERLQAVGVDWHVYRERDDFADNMLDHFVQFADPKTELYRRGRSVIADGQLPAKLRDDVVRGNLPQVSWIIGATHTSEHPDALLADGALYIDQILAALTADASSWAKTVLIITYDENGGFFDHATPPLPPPGTPGEYLTPAGLVKAGPLAGGISGPIGLGTRVPALIISPFSRGGYVCSETFDHTSILRFLEARFGAEVPNLSAWRRQTCGDLTGAFNFAASPELSVPALPDTAELVKEATANCAGRPAPSVPAEQVVAHQEPGTRPKPSGVVRGASVAARSTTQPDALPATGGGPTRVAATAAALAVGALVARRVSR